MNIGGFMTEAVKEMCHWALQQTCVTSVIAETSIDGIASQRIYIVVDLKRNVKGIPFGGESR